MKNKTLNPILSYFSVDGLNGYKDIKITLENNVKIISSENGTGKTTLLNMLYSILSGKVTRLFRINFKRFTLRINGKDISRKKSELFPKLNEMKKLKFSFKINRFIYDSLSEEDVYEIFISYATDPSIEFQKNKNVKKLLTETPLEINDIREIFDENIDSIYKQSESLLRLRKEIKNALDDISILYLPTYRRIEADLSEFEDSIFIERNRRYLNFRRISKRSKLN